jgi:DNA-binding IclR family transcriptional regulator
MRAKVLIKSLVTGLDILELVANSHDGIGLKTISDITGLPTTTAHNLISTLVHKGYLSKARQPRRYIMGPAVPHLVGRRPRALVERARQLLSSVWQQVPTAVVTLAQPLGGEVLTILETTPRGRIVHPDVGHNSPYFFASSLVYQAWCSPAELRFYRRRHPFDEPYVARFWRSPERMERFFENARQKGYVQLCRKGSNYFRISAPVFGADGALTSIFGAAALKTDITEEQKLLVRELVIQAAQELTQVAKEAGAVTIKSR